MLMEPLTHQSTQPAVVYSGRLTPLYCSVMCTARSLSKAITILYEVPPECSTTHSTELLLLIGAVLYECIHEWSGDF